MKDFWKVFLSTIFIVLMIVIAVIKYNEEPVHATVENNCEVIGTVGTVKIARCTDPDTWETIYANSAGYMEREK